MTLHSIYLQGLLGLDLQVDKGRHLFGAVEGSDFLRVMEKFFWSDMPHCPAPPRGTVLFCSSPDRPF